jgi:hypothetical protein
MERTQLEPLAEILVPAYHDTAAYSHTFRVDHGFPPTLFAKVHHMRAVVQARVTKGEVFTLDPAYAEFGRVQVTDGDSTCYLLRSSGAVSIEHAKRQGALFNAARFFRSDVVLVIYTFHEDGLDLSVAGTRRRAGSKRLELSGPPMFIGTWPYSTGSPSPFDQGAGDPFSELGDLPDESEGGGEVDRP